MQDNGCYNLVGENRFTNITLNISGLVSETPEPSNIISVQPGDVVGYYTFSQIEANDDDGEGIQLNRRYSNDSIWYANINGASTMGEPDCPFPVGHGRILTSLTNAGPILTVGIATGKSPIL